MSQSDRAIKKLATQLARLDREVKSWRGAQADYTSVENGGNFTFKDSDGNVTAIVGGQSDGSNTIRHVDGPTPPVPAGLSSHVDGPIIQATWDGTFEDGVDATYDWSHLEVLAVGPNNEQLRSTINDATGASVSLAATTSGEWAVYARSVSRAEKRSLDGDAGTVEVKVTDLSGAIEDVQQSANGKNNVTYSESPPTEADEGIVGDTWFVGATDSESGNWNVVAQYQYTADGWTQVELSHEVIATVDLGKATVGELDGIRIKAETVGTEVLKADAIDGMVITGATIRSAASGARVQLSANGIESFNSANERVFFAEASTGDVSMVGSFYSNKDGQPRVEIHNDDWASIGVPDDTGTVHYTNGSGIRVGSNASAGFSIYHGAYEASSSPGVIEGQAGVIEGPLGKSYMALLGQGDAILASVPEGGLSSARFDAKANGEARMRSRRADGSTISEVSARKDGTVQAASIRTNGNGYSSMVLGTSSAGMYTFDPSGAAQSLVRANVSGGVDIQSVSPVTIVSQSREVFRTQASGSSAVVVMPTVQALTDSNPANVYISGGGGLRRVSSSLRYKVEVEEKPISEYADELLSIPLKTWVDKGEYERRAEYREWRKTTPMGPAPAEYADFREDLPRIPGVIAEELDEAGLTEFVLYDDFGRPESVAYDRLGPALIPIVRDLRDRITELERLTHE